MGVPKKPLDFSSCDAPELCPQTPRILIQVALEDGIRLAPYAQEFVFSSTEGELVEHSRVLMSECGDDVSLEVLNAHCGP